MKYFLTDGIESPATEANATKYRIKAEDRRTLPSPIILGGGIPAAFKTTGPYNAEIISKTAIARTRYQ